jgi:hypothetical protein
LHIFLYAGLVSFQFPFFSRIDPLNHSFLTVNRPFTFPM